MLSAWRLERCSANEVTVELMSLASAGPFTASTSGEVRSVGTAWRKPKISPVFASPCGASAEIRSVQVSTTSPAANGIPSTIERQTAPPPSEIPQAPTCLPSISGRAVSQAKRALKSAISRGPSSEKSPPEVPWPRASNVSTA